MAAILQLRKGTDSTLSSIGNLSIGELFYNTDKEVLQIGTGNSNVTLTRLGINTGSTEFTGDITLGGSIFLGSGDAVDEIIVNASLSGSLIPDTDNTYDLGSATKQWKAIHAVDGKFGNGIVSGSSQIVAAFPSGVVSGSSQIISVLPSGTVSGSSQVSYVGLSNIPADIVSGSIQITGGSGLLSGSKTDISSLNTYTASNDINITNIHSTTSSLDSRLNNVEAATGSYLTTTGSVSFSDITSKPTLVSGSAQITYGDVLSIPSNIVSSSNNSTTVVHSITDGEITSNLIGGVVSGSSQINADSITNFDSNVKTKLDDETVISGSSQVDYSSISGINNNIISSSTDSNQVDMIINGGSISANLKGGVISGSIQILGGSGILSSSNQDFNSFSSSADSRLDTIEGAFSTSVDTRLDSLEGDTHTHANKANLDTINQNLSTTSNVTFNTGSFTGDMTITGDLTVLGAATEISSTELRIEDKLITVASGSADSAAADGAGIEIDGAGKSLQWDHNTTSFVFDAKVSSSVGFKGEGGELTGIDTDQVTEGSNLYYTDARVKTKLDADGVISGSSQVNYINLSSIPAGIVSGSSQVSYVDLSNIPAGIISGSIQVTGGSGLLSGSKTNISSLNSYTASNDTTNTTQNSRLDQLSTETGSITTEQSAQDVRLNQLSTATGSLNTKDNNQDVRLNQLSTETGSITSEQAIQDSRLDQLSTETGSITSEQLVQDTRISQLSAATSSYLTSVDISADTNLAVSDTSEVNMILTGDTISAELIGGVVSGSSFASSQQGSITASINSTITTLDLGLQTDDSPTFNSLSLSGLVTSSDSVLTALFVDSNQVKFNNLGTAALLHHSSSIADSNPNVIGTAQAVKTYIDAAMAEAGAGDITRVTAGAGMSGSTDSGNAVVAIDTGSAYFIAGVQAISPSLASGIISSSAQLANTSVSNESLNAATGSYLTSVPNAHINTSLNTFTSSIQTEVDGLSAATSSYLTSVPNASINTSLNAFTASNANTSLNAATSSYLTTVDISSDTNLGTTDTDNIHMILTGDNISANLKGGVVSGSAQIDVSSTTNFGNISQYSETKISESLDLRGVISGSSQIDHDSTTNFVANEHIDHSSITIGSGKGLSGGGTIDTNRSIFLDTGSAHFDEGIKKVIDADVVHSGSFLGSATTANLSENTNLYYTDARVKTKLDAETVISGSAQITSAITGGDLDMGGNKVLFGNVYSNEASLPNASTYHGMFAHVHNTGRGYFAHNGVWIPLVNLSDGAFSGSAQVAAGGDVSGNVDALTVEKIQGVSLTSGEATQLATIGTSTISSTQWGYLGGMDQDVISTSDVTFASASLSNVVISGNLKVLGDSVEIAVSDLKIEDKLITVASGSADSAAADGAGIEVAGANKSILWNHANTRFNINDDIHVTGTIKASDDIIAYASSDIELKNNIKPIDNPLEKINSISGNSFDWNEQKQDIYKGKDYGVIAQEIEKVLPELVQTRENGYKAVKYDKLVSLLIEGIKELSREVEELKNK